jgi:hypothetical protein
MKTDGGMTFRREFVDLPEVKDLIVRAQSLRIHWSGEGFTTNFQAKIDMDWSVAGRIYSTPVDLISAQVADGQTIGTDVSTRGSLGLNPRIAIAVKNGAGAAQESGLITAYLEIILQT